MSRHSGSSSPKRRQTEAEASVRSHREDLATSTATLIAPSYFTAPSSPYVSPYSPRTTAEALPARTVTSTSSFYPGVASAIGSGPASAAMSTYSSSSQDSLYSSPGPQHYQVVTPGMMNDPQNLSANDKERLIRALRMRQVNTLTELRRIERIFASLNSAEVTEPMTSAWAHYVNSNNLLNELRGMTKNYPFSSECLDEAKWQVVGDPASTRSWNYCWLVLSKIKSEGLIAKHARQLAAKPTMWGGRTPTAAGVEKLATACNTEWTRAVDQMLRNWSTPPSTTGR